MATSSRTRSSRPMLRSISPSGRYYSPRPAPESSLSATASAFASSTSSSFYSPPSSFFSHRSSSPTRVNVFNSSSMSPSVRFSIDRSTSPSRSLAVSPRHHVIRSQGGPAKKTCMCSPTTHPGSFRCSLHKNSVGGGGGSGHHGQSASFPSNRLNMRRSAMTNSIVRIGGVEGELMRRSLTALIRPSSHHLRRRAAFEPRPSRLSAMSKAEDR
ncbi:uncharacterized protein LOC115743520 [Rhodamnia argentea]|uniref:Uncharacterized protein LOC115743520 n=1 Tax=Rhodamnia argentea TaxID=178133 RepID=A0A8B8PID1_9MYRT|nr:uncharacterized protein LOC115743520 [Rhodamnia argentea]